MYPSPALNGLKTRPGLSGTGFATGNCVVLADVLDDGEGFPGGLLPATRDGALADCCFDLRDATPGPVGEGVATGWPGFLTSDVFEAGAGSGSLKT